MDNDSVTIHVVDQIGVQKQTLELIIPNLQLTVRELIQLRVYNEFTSVNMYFESASLQIKEIRKRLDVKLHQARKGIKTCNQGDIPLYGYSSKSINTCKSITTLHPSAILQATKLGTNQQIPARVLRRRTLIGEVKIQKEIGKRVISCPWSKNYIEVSV
jgi:hypothetical protein